MNYKITLKDIYKARKCISPYVRKTPLAASHQLSKITGSAVTLKLENLQETGAFKLRGATNRLLNLSEERLSRGVITVSSGNHGRAVSHIAHQLGVRAVVCISEFVPSNKIRAIRDIGGEVEIAGKTYDETLAHAVSLQEDQGLTMIESFDDPFVISGQGTIGVELLEELPEIDTVIVPLSGGSLFSGIAVALKSADPGIRMVGVSMERGPAMVKSLQAGRVVDIEEEPTLADGLVGGIGKDNQYTFDLVRNTIDEAVLVSEEEISGAMAFALREHQLVVEGAGAVGMAALLADKVGSLGEHVSVIISGGNVEIPVLLDQPLDSWGEPFGIETP
ncbi:MAG: hydroxyectoine utilization dehydratase EutB [Anaerolineales bacterium]